jgi:hypothetical protein
MAQERQMCLQDAIIGGSSVAHLVELNTIPVPIRPPVWRFRPVMLLLIEVQDQWAGISLPS